MSAPIEALELRMLHRLRRFAVAYSKRFGSSVDRQRTNFTKGYARGQATGADDLVRCIDRLLAKEQKSGDLFDLNDQRTRLELLEQRVSDIEFHLVL